MRPRGVSTSTNGSSQNMPREPLRTTLTSKPARRGFVSRWRARRRPRRQRAPRNRAEHKLSRSLRASAHCRSRKSATLGETRPYGSPSSITAGDSAQFPRQNTCSTVRLPSGVVSPSLTPSRFSTCCISASQPMDWHDFRAANLQHMLSRGRVAKVVIKTDDAMDFGVRNIQRASDQRRGGGIDISELFLQCMQDGQQSARQALQLPNPGLGPVRIPGLHLAHAK